MMTYSSSIATETNLAIQANNPDTYVVSAVGAVGTGKSSLLNAIAGSHIFETGSSTATTQTVRGEVRPWAFVPGKRYVHLIDTPGLCDSTSQDRHTVAEMVRYFKSLANGVSAFLLVFNINDIRLDAYTQTMLRLFEALLGRHFWNFVVIVFTHVDEENRDELEEHMEAVNDPQEGFIAEIRRIHNLPARTFVPSVIFTSTQNVRMSSYAQKHLKDIYNAVVLCETRNNQRRFTCTWLRRIMTIPTEEEKSTFITNSIKEAWSSMTTSVCSTQ
ncbi:P-loop containing nucleoside triphosphate hydrolase protein [Absidia repens]|uniref:p-loop containing nucleoside triphosphate hydrolase protein n=1 Tax=Absidia repens TaxID=90262 RepID=A0A1X2IJF2_9FUNG|nr:P-loop containing nucleoside triphosphate hydrolase protein [Absidia repens]